MKDTFYFSHDYNARTDEKIKKLIRKHGMTGYGVFWAIVEDLYNNANALQSDCEGIAFELRVDETMVKSILHEFDLFVFEGEHFGSLSVQKRMDDRDSRSKKARESAFKRWENMRTHSEGNANAMPMQSEGNAIKERKGKETKERKPKGIDFEVFYSQYPKKVAKFDGQRAWAKLKIEEQQPAIDAIQKLIAFTQPEFYPNPATYLNGKRWLDEFKKQEPEQQRRRLE